MVLHSYRANGSRSHHERSFAVLTLGKCPGTRDKYFLSGRDLAHQAFALLFVSADHRRVAFFNRAERGITKARVRLIPIEAGKVLLQPGVFEAAATSRVNFIPQFADVFQ